MTSNTLKHISRRLLLITALAFPALPALAQSNDEKSLSPGDIQAVFETLIYRKCLEQGKPLMDSMLKDLSVTNDDEKMTQRVCSCTTGLAMQSKRMQAVFALPPEKLKSISGDQETAALIKGKVAAALLQCAGRAIDNLIDPKAKP